MEPTFSSEKLADSQLESFDVEAVDRETWGYIRTNVDRDYPDGDFRLLDVGGGNGTFADLVLASYPKATATVVDSAQTLIERNTPNERKRLVHASIETAADKLLPPYDLISFNVILHHLVTRSYGKTIGNIRSALRLCRGLLSPRGRISILENVYNDRWVDGLASRVVYSITSSSLITPVARKLGANTAGVGVCFLSTRKWKRVLGAEGLTVIQYAEDSPRRVHRFHSLLLDEVRTAHFWCRPTDRSTNPGE